ncbi:gluconate 2-dehydrogenase subunit 3 family protein [Portibacter marinus]|uniref:gluconate 2-dehydrogenase subunit 3 family protein n=1 Tax=Portibacter marinus TaxID=2898660 RepID=UPI001F3C3D11|nr:gluconate 2-dehydrogenase subunit 3 family protein [Portibacter marinus]
MKRRQVLKYTALFTGAAVGAPLLLSLESCASEVKNVNTYKPQFFSEDDFAIVKKVVDTILPATDSPSASEVGVHVMIDDMVANVYPEPEKQIYADQSKVLMNHLNSLETIDKSQLLLIEQGDDEVLRNGFQALKQQSVAYYLNTEKVGKEFLNYLPVPGEYEGCIELSEVDGKAWAI